MVSQEEEALWKRHFFFVANEWLEGGGDE